MNKTKGIVEINNLKRTNNTVPALQAYKPRTGPPSIRETRSGSFIQGTTILLLQLFLPNWSMMLYASGNSTRKALYLFHDENVQGEGSKKMRI